uniref:NADH-ubiquinone oxidoreductase chain 2 n=1 Tax=Ocinebrellus inornatus TaxID=213425 RepID=A0A6G6C5T4_9CAEN|nr:NADH dehydrogenase subunit 2 [Ocinebrellus inornatus]YP_010399740.1 NADH dehydrogenase subunit 2 [Ceratostoma fournieri]QID76367.1 NADH dehydrogenase subunit 2 [Ocinebrellus inornatus]UQM88344.1 NADH dehydrogenase subunit 2 [Ceratostoma fournieri]UUL98754.1 NADH dehydrogenase subunit 2 [Ocinebrellus inornatus]
MFSTLPFGYMFLLVMGAGTLLSISSIHWLSIWAGLEINLIGFLPMLVYQKSVSESESAVKYFIAQALGSSFLIFGSLLMFNISFTWDLYTLMSLKTFGFLVMVSGLCVKLGLFPFHYWLPSVMAGLPWVTCLLLGTWQKIAPLFLMLCLVEMNHSYMLILILCIISAGSSLIGGFGGMNQTQIRALLAYSSIGHLGWMTFALLHSEWAMKFYLGVYIVISICMFLSLWKQESGNMKNIDGLKYSKSMQMNIMLLLLSLGGLPPLLGFISKWLVVLVGTSNALLWTLSLLILGSLMSLFYYLSLFFSVFLSSIKKESIVGGSIGMSGMLAFIITLNLLGGIFLVSNDLFSIL